MITQWDWADPKAYLHDEISTDKRNPDRQRQRPDLRIARGEPRLSAGPRSGAQHDEPGEAFRIAMPNTPGQPKPLKPSPVWGDEAIWDSHTTVHNPMFDERGRVWFTARIRARDNPAFCKAGSSLPSAKLTPVESSGRQLEVYDPATKQVSMIDTCFGTHHLLFAAGCQQHAVDQQRRWRRSRGLAEYQDVGPDARRGRNHRAGRRWCWTPTATASGTPMWKASREWPRRRAAKAWARRPRSTPPADPTKDTRLNAAFYGSGDRHRWDRLGHGAGFPGRDRAVESGIEPAGDVSGGILRSAVERPEGPSVGLIRRAEWTSTATASSGWRSASGHLASFDRRKCKGPLNGPKATGQQCPEGWTLVSDARDRSSRT